MKHYKSVEFLLNLNVKPPLQKRQAPPHKPKSPLLTTFWRRFSWEPCFLCTIMVFISRSN